LLSNRGTFHYLGIKFDPVKKTILLSAVSAAIFSFHACSDVEGSNIIMPALEKKETKSKPVVKTKKAKKERSVVVKPEKKETVQEKTPVKKIEKSSPEVNSVAMNVVANEAFSFAAKNGYSVKYCFFIDMSIASGSDRFFVYDLEKKSIVTSGLVAHGSCNETYLSRPRFSNALKCGCSSLGKYKVGEFYHGKYSKSYRLYGLDNSNSNAYKRAVVIHAYDCVPDKEIYPMVLCNSEGCAMVSYNFFDKLSRFINNSDKPILLWMYQ